jgi:CBS domain-containing protein
MASNTDRFLTTHNKIEEYLNKLVNPKTHLAYNDLINKAISSGNHTINRYQHDLRQFGRLRNAIVHTQRGEDFTIAEPNDWAVNRIENLAELITNPPKVKNFLKSKVIWVNADGSVAEALTLMISRNLSQAPIFKGDEFIGLLTANTIARWLAANINSTPVSGLRQENVLEIFETSTEDRENYCFLPLKSSIVAALDEFEKFERNGKRLEAILFTPSGKSSTDIQAIMTTWDIPKALSLVELSKSGK